MKEFQIRILNPTSQDVVIKDLISQSQGDMERKNEAEWIRYFVTGNNNSYYRILNDEKSLKIPKTTMICLLICKC